MLRRLLAFLALLVPLYAAAQTQIEPVGQIAWPALSGAGAPSQYCPTTVTGTTISGSPSVAVSTTVGVLPSQAVTGTGVPSSTTVLRMNAAVNTVTLSHTATASGIVSLTFFSYGMPYTDTVAHLVYYCVGSSGWQLLNGSAVAGAGFRLPAYPSSAGLAAPSNVTTDVTGNNLTVPGTATATTFAGAGTSLTGTASGLTAYDITAPSNSTLTSLPSLLLPYDQLSGSAPTWNQSTTGTAANITGTANSTLTSLPSLLLPYSQLSGSAPTWNQNTTGTAANVTGTSNSTLTSLPSLLLPYVQLSGSAPTWNQNTTGTAVNLSGSQTQHFVYAAPSGSSGNGGFRALIASDIPTLNQNTTGTAANVTGVSNSTLTTLSVLSLPYAQLSGSAPTWNQNTTGTASNVSGTPALPNGVTATSQSPVDVSSSKLATQLSVANMLASPPTIGGTTAAPVIGTTLTATGLGNSTAPVCPNGTANALTTIGCTPVTPPVSDSAWCQAIPMSGIANTNVCGLGVPANRVPYGGVYGVSALCVAAVGSGGAPSTFTPSIYFYDAATVTKFALASNVNTSTSVAFGSSATVVFTDFELVAPLSGVGFNQAGGLVQGWTSTGATNFYTGGQVTQPTTTAELVSTRDTNQIQVWMSTSVANSTPNYVTCQITGALKH